MTNPEFTELFNNMELRIIKLMEQIGVIPEQISQYMQNQAKIPPGVQGNNVPNFNPAMLGGGMLPGSNPMDLLQLQQFYQMQQMQMQQQPKKWSMIMYRRYLHANFVNFTDNAKAYSIFKLWISTYY